MTPRDTRMRVRHLSRLARTLSTKPYGPQALPIFLPCDMKAFRRAYTETEIHDPFQVTRSESGVDFAVCGHPIGHVNLEGAVSLAARTESNTGLPHVLAPSNTHCLAEFAYNQLRDRLRAAYEVSTGHQLLHDDARGGYFHSRRRALQGLAVLAVKRFCSYIDPDRLAALRHAQLATAHHARLVELVTGQFGLEWTQAIRAYPALINWAFDPIVPLSIVDAVQSRAPLIPALANHFRMSETEVRRFWGLTPQRCGRNPGADALRLILDLPVHLRPVRRRDWQAAFTLHCNLVAAFAHTQHLVGDLKPHPSTLLRGIKTSLGDVAGIDALLNLKDPVLSLAATGHHAGPMLRRLMGMTLSQMTTFCEAWHHETARVTRLARLEAARMLEVAGWAGVLPSPVLHLTGGLQVRELTTPGELVDEGARQGHCVASYVGDCYVGRSRILSVRCRTTGARTTAELIQRKVGAVRVIELAQHTFGPRNDPAPPAMDAAVRALVRDLNSRPVVPWPRLDDPTERTSWRSIQQRLEPWLFRRFGIPPELEQAA